ncbi:ANTAR domain-containing protein [Streptomyces sp. NPDC004561]
MASHPSHPSPRPPNGKQYPAVAGSGEQVARLEMEVTQLQRAVASHATIDQAIGVLICLHQLSPDDGFTVLRIASQLANTKLHTVAEAVITWAHTHQPLPARTKDVLDEARCLHPGADTFED